jgi:hypothetical protein
MRIVRHLAVVALTLLALLAIRHNSAAQISSSIGNAGVARPQAYWPPYTRTVTITIDTGPALAPALSSYWQTSFTGFSPSYGWNHQSFTLPSDATDITATVTGGTYQIVGNTVTFTLTDPLCDFAWSYRTSQKVLRQGNQYQIDQYASTNQDRPFVYVSTVHFTLPYQHVGQIGPAPEEITNAAVHWEESVPLNAPPDSHKFSSSMWLTDLRLARPDLKIVASDVPVKPQPGAPRVRVTAAIQNGGTIATGAPAYINIYDRKTPSEQPDGPLDLAGGWCDVSLLEQPNCPAFNSSLGITNALKIIGPGQVITLAADLTLTQPGRRDLWIQVDVLGGTNGLNLESEETNNRKYVDWVDNPYVTYLPLIVKGH